MESRKFFYEFGKMMYRMDSFYGNYAREHGFKTNVLWILYALNDGLQHSQKEISSTWSIPRTTLNTITCELKDKGYLELKKVPGEKREMYIQLTLAGRKYAESILKDIYLIEDKAMEDIDEPKKTLKMMRNVYKALNKDKEEDK